MNYFIDSIILFIIVCVIFTLQTNSQECNLNLIFISYNNMVLLKSFRKKYDVKY